MTDTTSLGGWRAVRMALGSAAAGFAFGETALVAFDSPLSEEDGPLLAVGARAAARVGSTGVGAVVAFLAFASALLSLGTGFHLAAAVMRLSTTTGVEGGRTRRPWLAEAAMAAAGVSVVAGAVAPGILWGVFPPWACAAALCFGVLLAAAYSKTYLDVNQMTAALTVVFTGLYLAVTYGRRGLGAGACCLGVTVAICCALRKALTERRKQHRPGHDDSDRYRLFDRMMLYSVVVAVLGFLIGLGASGSEAEAEADGTGGEKQRVEEEVAWTTMLHSVVRVGSLAAGLVGSALGVVAAVGLRGQPDGAAGWVAAGTAVTSSLALRLGLPALPLGGRLGTALGAATAAGVSLGSAGVAATAERRPRNAYLSFLASVAVGVVLSTRVRILAPLERAPLSLTELVTVSLVAVGAFVLGAPESPFHMAVSMRGGRRVAGPELFRVIAAEALSGAAAPLGAGVLGAAALGMAALGRLGTLGVLLAGTLAVGRTLMGEQ